jgi:very-short-patch-repair endonuclease
MTLNCSPKLLQVSVMYAKRLRRKQTYTEQLLWQELRGRKLGGWKFVRQRPILIDLEGVGTFAVADFYCAAAKLLLEVDGGIHEAREREDKARDQALAKRGYSVMRIVASDVQDHLQQVLERIDKEVRSRSRLRSLKPTSPLLLL